MKTKITTTFGIYFSLLIILFASFSCKDDDKGARFQIVIEQSGDYSSYDKEMILLSVGGLYDDIHEKDIATPILEEEYFGENKVSISTKEQVNLFMATLYVNGLKEDAVDPGNMTWEIRVYKDGQIVYEEIKEYTPQLKFPQAINISRD